MIVPNLIERGMGMEGNNETLSIILFLLAVIGFVATTVLWTSLSDPRQDGKPKGLLTGTMISFFVTCISGAYLLALDQCKGYGLADFIGNVILFVIVLAVILAIIEFIIGGIMHNGL